MILFLAERRDGAGSRVKILQVVRQDPGIHVSLLAKRAGLSWQTTRYHLRILQTQGLVQVDKGGRERRAFPLGVSTTHRSWLAALRTGEAAQVLRLLLTEPGQTIPALSRRMGHSEKVVRRQIANLSQAGLVQRKGHLRPLYEPAIHSPDLAAWLRSEQEEAGGGDGSASRGVDAPAPSSSPRPAVPPLP
jgi:DNA-binding IclR family transcriptional regulator